MDESMLEVDGSTLRLQCETLPSGEVRVRLLDERGLGYIRTQAPNSGGWQSSHFHQELRETYVVEAGWVVISQLGAGDTLLLSRLGPSGVWTATPGQPHNIYMGPAAITHVIKHGQLGEADWRTNVETERLDALSKAVSAHSLARLTGSDSGTEAG